MNARDELAEVIRSAEEYGPDHDYILPARAADAILAAGYRRPRTITTIEELDALPFESVIRDSGGCVLERWGSPKENLWASPAIAAYVPRTDVGLPATVIWEPSGE